MSTTNHTDIAVGAAGDSGIVNAPLGQLDAAIGNRTTLTTTNQSTLWLAAPERRFMAVSSGLGGSEETAREIARSTSFTSSARRRNQCVTASTLGVSGRTCRANHRVTGVTGEGALRLR